MTNTFSVLRNACTENIKQKQKIVYQPSYFSHSEQQGFFPGGSEGKESIYNAGEMGLIPVSGRTPRGGNGNPLQYSCLGNPINRGVYVSIINSQFKNVFFST